MTKVRLTATIAVALLVVSLVFVASAAATQTRTVPSGCINPGDEFTVTIASPGIGGVVETLCSGWTYTGSSLPAGQVDYTGDVVTFTLVGDTSFTYTVEAPDTPDTCTISGFFRDIDAIDHPIVDDTVCTCQNGAVTATRTVPSGCINPGDEFTVTIASPGTGGVVETLCSGWTYTGSSLPAGQVDYTDDVVTFTLIGDTSFTYTVEAPDTPDTCCTISGFFRDIDAIDHPIVDDTVCTCTDNDPPAVTVTDPTSGTVSGTIVATADADDDPDGTVTQVEFFLMPDGSSIGTDANADGGWSVSLDTTTVGDGDYQIKAVATDDEGATGDDTGGMFAIDNGFCLELEAGLNFVSIPKTLNGSKVAEIVFSIDSTTGEFCLYYNAATGSYDTDPLVKPGRGYWVHKNAATSICVSFDYTATAPSQQLYKGWNMIGHIDTEELPIYEVGNTADFGSVTGLEEPEETKLFRQVSTYTQDSRWINYPTGDLTTMTPGVGYWILVKEDVMMYGMP